mgnify:CR=1 FL=1
MPLFKKCEEYVYIRELVDKGIYPYFHELESKQDIEVMMEGKRRIMLGSNNYLGLTVNQEVIDAGVEAMKKYGTGCSGSRFLNGTLDLHNKLERELADFLGTEDCVTFSTGFQSNLGIISAICGRQDYIFNDRENHASIYDGCKLSYAKVTRYRHNDMADLEKRLAETPTDAGKLIVTDGVFSMSGDICRLPDIAELAHKYKARVMVDDAHGLGVIGKGGRGTASYFGLEKEVDITMGTFSKSLASLGGYIDFTAGTNPSYVAGILNTAFSRAPKDRVTLSSDGNGSLPMWNEKKELIGITAGRVSADHDVICAMVNEFGYKYSDAIRVLTENPAKALKLYPYKGLLAAGSCADILLLSDALAIDTVIANGKLFKLHGKSMYTPKFE